MWACIRAGESGGDYSTNTGNGFSGAYQFTPSTWASAARSAGYGPGSSGGDYADGPAYEAPPAVQDAAAQTLGFGNWPVTSVRCGV